jgi:predicted phage terminase large subunit-like protein
MDLDNIPVKELLKYSPAYFIQKVWGFRVDDVNGQMLDYLIDKRRGLLLCPRGHGKSKINQAYISWYILHNPNKRVILVSDSDGKAQSFLRTIKAVLESSPIIKEFYGDIKGSRWTDHAITLKGRTEILTEPNLMCVGAGSGAATGLHCDWLILDDLVSFHSSRSELQRERDKDWFKTTLLPVLMSSGKISVVGTRYHQNDFYSMLINDLNYDPLILPAIKENGEALIPWLVPLKDRENDDGSFQEGLETIRENLGSVIWSLQYLNDASILSEDAIIKADYIQYYQNIKWEDNQLFVINNGKRIKIVKVNLGFDPAIGEKETNDFSAAVVIGKGSDNMFYVLEVSNKHLTLNAQIEEIQRLVMKWQVNQSLIEDVAYQKALIQELKRKTGLKIVPITPTRDKVARLNMVSGHFEAQKVYFKKDMNQIINQLLCFPDDSHDDLVDACVYSLWGYKSSGSGMIVLRM